MANVAHGSRFDLLKVYAPVGLLVLAAFVLAYQFVGPAPPRHLTISTGGPQGAYSQFAQRYAEILARNGIELEILPSAGSLENLQRLSQGKADIAFVQGGSVGAGADPDLRSLGSLYFEPLWVFYRGQDVLHRLTDLRGKRLAVGPPGSGTRALAMTLLRANGLLDHQALESVDLGGSEAVTALKQGQVDGLMLVAGPDSSQVRRLMESPGIVPMDMVRARAYGRLYPYLSPVRLPEGIFDLRRDVPAAEVRLVAPAANLVASEQVHPALLDLLLQAASEVHGPGGWFEERGRFPAADLLVFPLHPAAKRFFKYGPPLLQRYLPFWAATLVGRLKVMLLPLLVMLVPVIKILPPVYKWRMRSRIYRWYHELDEVERGIRQAPDRESLAGFEAELDRIEDEVVRVAVPLSFAGQAYDLRLHVEMIRRRLAVAQPSPSESASASA